MKAYHKKKKKNPQPGTLQSSYDNKTDDKWQHAC